MNGICTIVTKKKKPFIGDKKFFEHFNFKVVDEVNDYELLALQFNDKTPPKFFVSFHFNIANKIIKQKEKIDFLKPTHLLNKVLIYILKINTRITIFINLFLFDKVRSGLLLLFCTLI